MKRYNLSQIMKSAWRSYKRAGNERTFSECLKSAWSLAKLQEYCSPEAVKARRHEAMSNAAKATKDKGYNNKNIPVSAYYTASTGRYGAHYVGD